MQRRHFLKLMGTGLVVWQTPVFATGTEKKNKKIVWIILRGAMDSLHAVVPVFDKHLAQHRGDLIKPIKDQLLPLDRGFGLHPDLAYLHKLYQDKQFSPVVAVATLYRERSHFDAQDLLESGQTPVDHDSGWLARAVTQHHGTGLAVARSVPIVLRGSKDIQTWYPSNLPDAEQDLYARLMELYKNDAKLSARLQEAIETQNRVGEINTKRRPKLEELAKSCAILLQDETGPDCAMMEMGGWDTHNNQANRLSNQFKQLDSSLKALHAGLGDAWQDTLVIIATEFGRTVAINGTRGTDHGTASALFLTGGAVQGGNVFGDWPGLAPENLYQGRDLKPTSDLLSWIGAAVQQHWRLSSKQIASIFPASSPVNTRLV